MAVDLERAPAAAALAAARRRLPNLVGRDPQALDAPEIARATVESVAENTSDAQVAPLFWGAVAGLPGLVGYRAINTLDAMVGHRSPRYRDFGTASARLDDVANLAAVPADRAAHGRDRAAGRRRRRGRVDDLAGATATGIRARTPASARRRWPVRSACGSVGATSITAGSRTGRCSGSGRCRARPTCGEPRGSPAAVGVAALVVCGGRGA